jgi:hypothetical protein
MPLSPKRYFRFAAEPATSSDRFKVIYTVMTTLIQAMCHLDIKYSSARNSHNATVDWSSEEKSMCTRVSFGF